MQSSCLSPTEKFSPFSSTSACSLCGNFRICRVGRTREVTRACGRGGGIGRPLRRPLCLAPLVSAPLSSPPTPAGSRSASALSWRPGPAPGAAARSQAFACPPSPTSAVSSAHTEPAPWCPGVIPSHETGPPCGASVVPGGRRLRESGQARPRLRSPSCSGRSSPGRPRSARPCAGQRGPGSTCPGRRPCSVTTRLGSLSQPRRGRGRGRGPGVTEATDPRRAFPGPGGTCPFCRQQSGFCLGPPAPQPPSPGA